jgi:hypothetical protein
MQPAAQHLDVGVAAAHEHEIGLDRVHGLDGNAPRGDPRMPDAKPDLAALWRDFARRVEGLSALVLGEGTPADDEQRAAGLRYLTRFLAAGLRLCIEADDADHRSSRA